MTSDHSIQRLEIQAYGIDTDLSSHIYETLEGSQSQLLYVIEEVLAQHDWSNAEVLLSQIHLDVGTLPTEDFMPILTSRLKVLLTEQLQNLCNTEHYKTLQHATLQRSISSLSSERLEHLRNFLLKGFNEHLQADPMFNFEDFLLQLAKEQSVAVLNLLKNLLAVKTARARVLQLNLEVWLQLKQLLPELNQVWERYLEYTSFPSVKTYVGLFQLMEHYLNTGKLSWLHVSYHPSDLAYVVRTLEEPKALEGIASIVLKNLDNELFVDRLCASLDLNTLTYIFIGSRVFDTDMHIWQHLSQAFQWKADAGAMNRLFLKYINYRADIAKQVSLILDFLLHQSPSLKELHQLIQSLIFKDDHASADTRAWLKALAAEADSYRMRFVKTHDDLDLVLRYLSYATPDLGQANLMVLLPQLWTSKPKGLAEGLRDGWHIDGLRYRLAYGLDIKQLEHTRAQLWGGHASAPLWKNLRLSLHSLRNHLGDGLWEKTLRRLHLLYFEYLKAHSAESIDPDHWQAWMQKRLFTFLSHERGSYEAARLSTLIFPGSVQNYLWTNTLAQAVLQGELQRSVDILIQLLDMDLRDEIALYIDVLLTQAAMLRAVWKSEYFSSAVLRRLLGFLQSAQIRALCQALLLDVSGNLHAFLGELGSWVRQQVYRAESEKLMHMLHIFLLDQLHHDKLEVDVNGLKEALLQMVSEKTGARMLGIIPAQGINQTLVREQLKKYEALANSRQKTTSSYLLEEYVPMLKSSVVDASLDQDTEKISWDEFLQLLEYNFPGISGFVQTYVMALQVILNSNYSVDNKSIEDIQAQLYTYMRAHASAFSAKSFLWDQITLMQRIFKKDAKALLKELSAVATAHENSGMQRFAVLGALLQELTDEPKTVPIQDEDHQMPYSRHMKQDVESLRLATLFQVLMENCSKIVSERSKLGDTLATLWMKHPQHVLEIVKFALSGTQQVELFWNNTDRYTQRLVISILSQSFQQSLKASIDNLGKFLQYIHPEMSLSDLDDIIHKLLLFSILREPNSTYFLTDHLKYVLQEFYQRKVSNLEVLARNVEAYSTTMSAHAGLSLLIAEQTAMFLKKGPELAKNNNEAQEPELMMMQQHDFVFKVLLASKETVRAELELLLPQKILLHICKGKHLPKAFWWQLHNKASDVQLKRILEAVAPSIYAHWYALKKEVDTLLSEYPVYSPLFKTTSEQFVDLFDVLQSNDYKVVVVEDLAIEVLFSGSYAREASLSEALRYEFANMEMSLRYPKLAQYFNTFPVQNINQGHNLSAFLGRIAQAYPSVHGFVKIYMLCLQETLPVCGTSLDQIGKRIYVAVDDYLEKHVHTFSAMSFIKHITNELCSAISLNINDLSMSMLQVCTAKANANSSAYEVLKELLEYNISDVSKGIALDELARAEDRESPSTAVEVQLPETELFKQALIEYVRQGTWSALGRSTSKNQFVDELRVFFEAHQGRVFPMLKTSWPSTSVISSFLHREGDEAVIQLLLKEFAGNRYAEFSTWQEVLYDLLLYLQPALVHGLARKSTYQAFFELMSTHSSSSIGLYAYVSIVVDVLKKQSVSLFDDHTAQALLRYPQTGTTAQLVLKAMAWLEQQHMAQRRKDLLQQIIMEREAIAEIRIEGRLLIHNAGLVLLGPFLQRYFARLAMLEGQAFKSEDEAIRGVQLLQFLATGHHEMQEHQLVFNKILCGLPLATFIPFKIELTEEERQVSESLLRGVLSNWGKIKTQSIDALREGFLQRSGYLEEHASGWKLAVVRKAQDVLVDMIPWGYSMIKMPWMTKSLSTQWGKDLGI